MPSIKIYEGRFGYEQYLFELDSDAEWLPIKDEFIFYNENVYKVLYIISDYDNNEIDIFVRMATEEDY